MREDRFRRMRMGGGGLIAPTASRAINQRHLEHAVKEITHFPRMIGNGIKRQKSEIDGHEFGDGAQASHGRSNREAANRHLANRRIANTFFAKLLEEAARYTVRTLPIGNFFSHDKDIFIAPHFFLQCPADGFPHGDVSCCHHSFLMW